jgi:hypothetical protein
MRRNILTYKAPPTNEGYDLICIHPDPRHKPGKDEMPQVLIQVKSRYATDCSPHVIVKKASLDAFHFLVVVFQNIGNFYRGRDGLGGAALSEFYTFPASFIREHFDTSSGWPKVNLRGLKKEIELYKNEAGFELIARALGIALPQRLTRRSNSS